MSETMLFRAHDVKNPDGTIFEFQITIERLKLIKEQQTIISHGGSRFVVKNIAIPLESSIGHIYVSEVFYENSTNRFVYDSSKNSEI